MYYGFTIFLDMYHGNTVLFFKVFFKPISFSIVVHIKVQSDTHHFITLLFFKEAKLKLPVDLQHYSPHAKFEW